MEQIHPDEMVPDTKYIIEDPHAVALAKLLHKYNIEDTTKLIHKKIFKTVIFKRVAYGINGIWHYLFYLNGRRRYFTSNDIFYKYVPEDEFGCFNVLKE